MEQFKHLDISQLKHMKNKILYTKFSIKWVFLTLITMLVAIIYALIQSI